MSLQATMVAIGEAWLAGDAPTRFTLAALQTTQALVEKQRRSLTQSAPEALADPAIKSLNDTQTQLSVTLALLWKAVNENDRVAARRHLSMLEQRG